MIAFQSINIFQLKISTLSCLATIARQDRIMNIYYMLVSTLFCLATIARQDRVMNIYYMLVIFI